MRNRRSPDDAADLDATTAGNVTIPGAVKGFFADLERLKGHVDGIALRERIAEQTMSVMTAYLAGELSSDDAAQLEQFMQTEPLLRETYAGLVAAWQAPNAERIVTHDEVDAGYARFKAKLAAKTKSPEQ